MRLHQHRGIYHCEFPGGRRISLRTRDKELATDKVRFMANEMETVRLLAEVVKEQRKILTEIETRQTKLLRIIEDSNIFDAMGSDRKRSTFTDELEMETTLEHDLKIRLGLNSIEHQKVCQSGTVDIFGLCNGRRIIVEFKLGSIKEDHLGQCLRYLSDESLKADELWLIGEGLNKTSEIFKNFAAIKVFVTNPSPKAKHKIRPAINALERVIKKRSGTPKSLNG